MKKKITASLLLIFTVCVTACGKEKNNQIQTFDIQSEISTVEHTSVEQEETKENTVEDATAVEAIERESLSIEDSTKEDASKEDNSLVTFTEDEYGDRLYYADAENYMAAYKMYLTDNLEEHFFAALICEQESNSSSYYYYPYYGPKFCLYDLNGDGMKELIISGALGLRCKMLSTVAYWNGDTFTSIEYGGEPCMIGSNMIMFDDPDYGGAGEQQYTHEYVDLFDEKGNSKTILEYNVMEEYTEKENEEDSYELVYETYYVEGSEVSEEEYKTKEETLTKQMKNIEMYDLTLENIEKYVIE